MNTRLVNIPTYINEYVINYITEQVKLKSEEEFDEEMFVEWLKVNDIEHKNNPNGYIKSCFKKELDRGTFRGRAIVKYVPNTQVLINEMRDRGICVLADDSVWLGVIWGHLINFQSLSMSQCRSLNQKILNYMGDSKSFSDYKKLLKNSQALKPLNINWEALEAVVEFEITKWNKTLDELESEE